MTAHEVNFDGLVGLTHHYAGLSFGNEASTRHRFSGGEPSSGGEAGAAKDESTGGCRLSPGRDPAA
ncbi:succinylarginine dihydrolase [Salmonella enterica subsp. arizonae]|uniref:Succinylarginine dihydrolase n=1 Tax=Salmonella enterica subsp. arizonae TaxID=59203 RepID=A0A379TBS5_SALER|nr:succinylarginine dihydrolase [Salmonella enterica subsp. arizonae]